MELNESSLLKLKTLHAFSKACFLQNILEFGFCSLACLQKANNPSHRVFQLLKNFREEIRTSPETHIVKAVKQVIAVTPSVFRNPWNTKCSGAQYLLVGVQIQRLLLVAGTDLLLKNERSTKSYLLR